MPDCQPPWPYGFLRVCVPQRGFRTRVILVATTLLDA
jgi:hypothetical protein